MFTFYRKTIHLEEEKNHKLAEDFRAAIANGNIDAVKTVLTQGTVIEIKKRLICHTTLLSLVMENHM